MSPFTFPLPLFSFAGATVQSGSLYLGVANTNPVTNPVTVYLDAAGTIVMSNPLTIRDGYIMNGAFPAVIYTSTNCSLSLYDLHGNLLLTLPDSAIFSDYLSDSSSVTRGDALVAVKQPFTGAVARTQHTKNAETLSVTDFGATGDGVTDDSPAFNAAIAAIQGTIFGTGQIFVPRGLYFLHSPVTLTGVGMRLYGDSTHGSYLRTVDGSTNDMIRMAADMQEVDHLHFRPGSGGGNVNIKVYGGHARIHDNRFLSGSTGLGTAIILTDINPVTSGFIAGAYTHNIYNNFSGGTGYNYEHWIDDASTQGITSCQIHGNSVFSNSPIRITKGGGNVYHDNLLQSATGGTGAGVGNGIDLGTLVFNEVICNNYLEHFQYPIITRATLDTYRAVTAFGNEYDQNTNDRVFAATNHNNYEENMVDNETLYPFGWKFIYQYPGSNAYFKTSNNTELIEFDETGGVGIGILKNKPATLTFSANSQTQTPSHNVNFITGGGAHRTNCVLGKSGIANGFCVRLVGISWNVQLLNTTIHFVGAAASANFGNTTGLVMAMDLVYDTGNALWFEVSRTLY